MLKNTTDQPIPKESNKINQTLSGRMKESYVLIFLWFSFRTECPDFADGRKSSSKFELLSIQKFL